jgi:hypothetical protein
VQKRAGHVRSACVGGSAVIVGEGRFDRPA